MIDDAPVSRSHHGGFWHMDALAISASTLCLIHCLVLPVLIAFLPAIAEWADLGEVFHIVMLALAVPLSSLTLFGGWRRHGVVFPMIAGAVGLLLLMLGLAFEGQGMGTALTVAGGLVLTVAHVANLRATNLHRLMTL
ncbi:MerC domain-containing protein [Sphingomonas sanguinis]|uniref:MerC domain-containing protein n=1 Tax=Sphingomonas sanguinis TaxID=33051 RepID=A0ABU5LLN1_9SPHN|nr:MerC domain-containing protein [Sphingomonas sanguinis]MDZ7280822.1 MerC domain-containing protein [Sphingomonas sanguinis]